MAKAELAQRAQPRGAERAAGEGATRSAATRYRMRDLCQATGLERQTIHFYIQEGLLPEGKKTGRNMAYYSEEHVERLRLIKQLQEERFLPLRAIRAILGGKAGGFSPQQRHLITDVKERLLGDPRGRALVGGSTERVGVRELAVAYGVSTADVEEMIEVGLLSAEGTAKSRRVRREDSWLVGAYGELSRAGLGRDRGFSPRDMAVIDEAIGALFARERELFFERLEHLGPDELARVLERVLPILSDVIARMHMHKARDLFALAADDRERAERPRQS